MKAGLLNRAQLAEKDYFDSWVCVDFSPSWRKGMVVEMPHSMAWRFTGDEENRKQIRRNI